MAEISDWDIRLEEQHEDPAGATPHRRFHILGLLGRGGFGSVYRARMTLPDGFSKIVALKLLRNGDVPEEVIQRFRDEAKVLGLIRDRAIVAVEPPTRLNGRRALVMECVEGVSAHLLLKRGPLPPIVALAMVAEIARALDKVYHQPGPDGQPLHLLHRDIKPANVHITPDGDIKLLDFGIAKANFELREAETSTHVGGTLGYIAPERLRGIEGPEGDVYSMGVMLHVLVTGDKAVDVLEKGPDVAEITEPGLRGALALAEAMRAHDPGDRPTAKQVEAHCRKLLSLLAGMELRQWSRVMVPAAVESKDDDLVGVVLNETLATAAITRSPRAEGRTAPLLIGSVVGLAGLTAGGVALLLAVLAILWVGLQPAPGLDVLVLDPGATEPAPGLPAAATPGTGEALQQGGAVTPGTGEALQQGEAAAGPGAGEAGEAGEADGAAQGGPGEAAPGPASGAAQGSASEAAQGGTERSRVSPQPPGRPRSTPGPSRPQPAVAPAPRASGPRRPSAAPPTAAPEPAPPEPPSKAPAPSLSRVRFDAAQEGSSVYIDNNYVGKTPIAQIPLLAGRHNVRMVAPDGTQISRNIEIGGRRGSTDFTWSGGDTLLAR